MLRASYSYSIAAIFLLSLSACDEKALNRKSEEIIKVTKSYASDPIGKTVGSVTPVFDDGLESVNRARETSENTHNAVKNLTDTIDSVKETKAETEQSIASGKESLKRGTESVKKSVKRFVHKIPRSHKEANQLAFSEGKGLFDWVRSNLISFQQKHEGRFNPRERHKGRSRK